METEMGIKEKEKKKIRKVEKTMTPSILDYAMHVMRHCLVTGVPNIIETKNWGRKIFKTTVLLLCMAGFFYQATEFVAFIRTYPTVVDIQVYTPEYYPAPAFTVCNFNGIPRSKFCAKYPERCYTPNNETFCEIYKSFCSAFNDTSNLTVVKPEFYNFEKNITFEELQELNDVNSFVIQDTEYEEKLIGPILVRRSSGELLLCYSQYLRVDSPLDPIMKKKPDRFSSVIVLQEYDLQPKEVFRPYRQPSAFFNLHSPFVFEDPIQRGFIFRPNREYVVHMRMEEEQLLPYPYPSDCLNYTKLWLEKGRKGPRSQESCIEHCEFESNFLDCNCTFPEVFYPSKGPFCTEIYSWCSDDTRIEELVDYYDLCVATCKDDCEKRKFRYEFQSRDMEIDPADISSSRVMATVTIIAADPEIVKYHYRPQYQDLEIFSYIGGYIGAWLGVSLVAVIDFLESLTMVACYFLRRKKLSKIREENEEAEEKNALSLETKDLSCS